MEQAATLPPDLLAKVEARDIKNILRCVEQGRPLTAAQHNRLREFLAKQPNVPTPAGANADFVSSWTALAQALGGSHRAFRNWSHRYPDAPKPDGGGRHRLSAWRAFMAEKGLVLRSAVATSHAVEPKESGDRRELEARKLRAQAEKIEFELSVSRGEYTRNDIIAGRLRELATRQQALLRQTLENEYPLSVAGLEPAAVREYGARLVDRLCAQMQELAGAWQ